MQVKIKFISGEIKRYEIKNKYGVYESGLDLVVIVSEEMKLIFGLRYIQKYEVSE